MASPCTAGRGQEGQRTARHGKDFSDRNRMRKLKAAELVLDFAIYPRQNVSSTNVNTLIDALASGAELPPVIIDKKSKRVIDGFHRVRAHLRHFGEDKAEITVIEKSYPTEAALFVDAMKYNAVHGYQLDTADRTHCVILAEKLSIPIDIVAGALNVPVDKLGALRTDRTAMAGGLVVPLKRTIQHMAGKRLNKRQAEANTRLSGMNQQFYANQLISLIEAELLDLENESLMERLRLLHELLGNVVATAT